MPQDKLFSCGKVKTLIEIKNIYFTLLASTEKYQHYK